MRVSFAGIGPTRIRSDRKQKYYKRLAALYGDVCFYCTRPFAGVEHLRTLDHLTPLALGGTNLFENVVLCCTKCNNTKRDRLFSDYFGSEEYVKRRANAIYLRAHPPKVRVRAEVVRDLVVA